MKVKIGNSYSETQNIPFGISQGSVLELLLFLIFINNLTNDIKSEIELFTEDIKLLVRTLSKETQIGLDKLLYLEDIWKLKFYIEKYKVLYIQVEYELSSRETIKVNED